MSPLTAEQVAAGMPGFVSSSQLMAVLAELGVAPEVAQNVSAVELGPKQVVVTAYALADGRHVRVVVDVPVRFDAGSRLEAWQADAERARNGSGS